jgi:hypothetical protein
MQSFKTNSYIHIYTYVRTGSKHDEKLSENENVKDMKDYAEFYYLSWGKIIDMPDGLGVIDDDGGELICI